LRDFEFTTMVSVLSAHHGQLTDEAAGMPLPYVW
jgi:hypothetical protein